MAYVGFTDCGGIKNALFQCAACQRHYNVNGYVGCEGPLFWLEPYSENYCQECFPKFPGEVPVFSKMEK